MKPILLSCFFMAACCPTLSAQINWQHTNGPEGGAVGYMYTNGQYTFYPDEYFLYRCADGLHWEQLPYGNLWPMAVSPTTLVALQGYGFNYTPADKRLLISHDNGTNWLEGTLPPTGGFSGIAVCSHGIYVSDGAQSKMFRSQDDGLTWDTITPPGSYTYDVWAFDDRLYAEWYSKFWRLNDAGTAWELVSPDFDSGDYPFSMFATGSHLLFATENHLWGSPDGGLTWNKTATNYHNSVDQFIQIGNRIYKNSGSSGVLFTEDFGVTWTALPATEPVNIFQLGLAGGRLLASTYSQGVFRLDEPTKRFVPANDGLFSAGVYYLENSPTALWAVCGNGVFAYDLATRQWGGNAPLPLSNYPFSQVASSPSGKIAAAGNDFNKFCLSLDAGASWDTIYPYQSLGDWGYIHQLVWLGDSLVVKGESSADLWSADFGKTWTYYNCPEQVVAFKGKYYGLRYGSTTLVSSADQGMNWVPESGPNVMYPTALYATDDLLFIRGYTQNGLGQEALYSSADGVNWRFSHDGLPNHDIISDPSEFYFGNIWRRDNKYYLYDPQIGFFASLDTCQTWLPLQYLPYNYMALIDTTFYTGGFGGGVLQTGLPQQYGALTSGLVFKDDNNNGLADPGEIPLPNVQVQVEEPGAWYPFWFTTTQTDGRYVIGSTPGSTDTLRPRVNSPYVEQVNPPLHLVTGGGTDRNFGVHFKADVTDVSITGGLSGRPRPGFALSGSLQFANEGTVPANGTVSLRIDPQFQFTSADPAPTAVIGTDSLVWDFSQLPLFERRLIRFSGQISPGTPIGSALKMYGHIKPGLPDANPANNDFVFRDTVVGSYDPNEKRVDPAEGLTPAEIAAGKALQYTIQFQNTGTFPAGRVRITDQLDTALQLGTLRLVASSHPVSVFRVLPGRLLEIVFDPITLPDSLSDEAASHGFVTIVIQRNKAYNAGRPVPNRASIYFDFNDPVITNTVSSGVRLDPVATEEPAAPGRSATLRMAPNPAPAGFTVYVNGWLSGPGMLEVSNPAGQVCYRQAVADVARPVRVTEVRLPDGLYVVRVQGREGVVAGKLVVQR